LASACCGPLNNDLDFDSHSACSLSAVGQFVTNFLKLLVTPSDETPHFRFPDNSTFHENSSWGSCPTILLRACWMGGDSRFAFVPFVVDLRCCCCPAVKRSGFDTFQSSSLPKPRPTTSTWPRNGLCHQQRNAVSLQDEGALTGTQRRQPHLSSSLALEPSSQSSLVAHMKAADFQLLEP
jgi:hypothetical protein